MKYYIEKKLSLSFEAAVGKVTETLRKEGFGILAEITSFKQGGIYAGTKS